MAKLLTQRKQPPKDGIAFVISDLEVGGAQRVLSNLVNHLTKDNYPITLITLESSQTDYFKIDNRIRRIELGVRVIRAPSEGVYIAIKRNLQRVSALRNAIKASEASCTVSFLGRINILLIMATLFLGKKVIISERNDPAKESLGVLWDLLRRLLYRYADIVTANSRGALKSMSRYVPYRKLRYVPNVRAKAEIVDGLFDREKWILAVGRLEQQKGYDVLLAAFAEIYSRLVDWKLIIIGEGSQQEFLKNLANELNIPKKRIQWVGEANPHPFYIKASVFVLPSRFEGTPNSMLEAMASGATVVVSDASSGPLEYIKNQETGVVFPVNDVGVLAEVLEEVAMNSTLRERLAISAKKRLEDEVDAISVWKSLLESGAESSIKLDTRTALD